MPKSNKYFDQFPFLQYDVVGVKDEKLVTDILKRIRVRSEALEKNVLFDSYFWEDRDRPDIVAHKFYGDSNLHWVIILVNRALNPYFAFPLATADLHKFVVDKHGSLTGIHHYENADGFQVNSTEPGAVAVSNLDYEESINESKRTVKILKPEFVQTFVNEFNNLINS